ncbi:hypothetical protein [Muricoccus radiodurans]|uniref:hypothetical protein n=1 Tax=Muricoccus radiodurans TaxID=2231721 RepID=UPI003CFB8871
MLVTEPGFAVAMRGVVSLHRPGRRRSESRRFNIWLIVSRFGRSGELLTLSYAGRARSAAVPLGLSARLTALAQQDDVPEAAIPGPFTILPPPDGLAIAGRPVTVTGRAQLIGDAPEIGLLAAGQTRNRLQWGLLAWRKGWVGEVFDTEPGVGAFASRLVTSHDRA